MNKIYDFRGKFSFLSNFYECPVTYKGLTYKSSEAAFQAAKTLDSRQRAVFTKYNPSEAKRAGRRMLLRPDWESCKNLVMYEIVKAKFEQNPDLRKLLLETGDAEIIEGNTWNDQYWGVCNGIGENHLGKILMRVREEFRTRA